VVFASYDLAEPLQAADATGFPEAVWDSSGTVRDYTVRGDLRIATQNAPYAWTVPVADRPDDPRQWAGMSGSVVGHVDSVDRLHVFGSVQHVPPNFSGGMLSVARLSAAFQDGDFTMLIRTALKLETVPALVPGPLAARMLLDFPQTGSVFLPVATQQ
jgi:hypothetical protein